MATSTSSGKPAYCKSKKRFREYPEPSCALKILITENICWSVYFPINLYFNLVVRDDLRCRSLKSKWLAGFNFFLISSMTQPI